MDRIHLEFCKQCFSITVIDLRIKEAEQSIQSCETIKDIIRTHISEIKHIRNYLSTIKNSIGYKNASDHDRDLMIASNYNTVSGKDLYMILCSGYLGYNSGFSVHSTAWYAARDHLGKPSLENALYDLQYISIDDLEGGIALQDCYQKAIERDLDRLADIRYTMDSKDPLIETQSCPVYSDSSDSSDDL
jgi:hypothetical protein